MRAAEIAYGLPTSPPAITSDARVEEIIGNFRAQCMWHTSEFDREQCLSCAHFASIFLQETHSGMDEHASRRGLEQNQFNVLGLSTSHSPTPTASSSPISDSLSDARSKVRILHEREDHPHMCHTQRTEDGNLGLQWLAEDCLRLGAGDLEDRGAEERHSRLQKAGDKGRRRVAKFTPWCYDNEPQEGSLLQEEAVRKRLLRESQLNCKECQQVRLEDESEEILEIVVGGCIVTFSAGLTVQHVVTGFERCKIFVRNIPQNVGEEEIVGLLSTYCLGSQYMVVTDRRRLASKWELSVMMKVDVMGQIRARADKLELRGKPLDIEFGISNDLGREETSKVQHTRRAAPILPNLGSDRFICNICFNTPIAPRSIPCGHVYCTGCLHHMFASVSSGSSFPLCCLGDEARCSFPIPLSLIREFVASVAFDHLLSLAFDVHIAHHPDAFHPCPTPDCNQLYRPQRYTRRLCCPSCRLVICAMCGGDWHPGMNCEQARLAKKKDEQERLTEEYFRSQRVDKRCPACNMAISKIEGCNHMTCKCVELFKFHYRPADFTHYVDAVFTSAGGALRSLLQMSFTTTCGMPMETSMSLTLLHYLPPRKLSQMWLKFNLRSTTYPTMIKQFDFDHCFTRRLCLLTSPRTHKTLSSASIITSSESYFVKLREIESVPERHIERNCQ